MSKHLFSKALTIISLVAAVGCASDDPAEEQTTDNQIASTEGQLGIRLVGSDDVVGFDVEVLRNGVRASNRFVSLEEETLDRNLLDTRSLGELSGQHRFSDAFFVLSPGDYEVRATPMAGPNRASAFCSRGTTRGLVREGATTEILLLVPCKSKQNGALDVVTILNHPPVIRKLDIGPSKFARTCERTTVTVEAADADGDEVRITWAVVSQPAGALFDAVQAGNTFSFTARTPGNYQIKVTACDRALQALCTSLTFPIHVGGLLSNCGVTQMPDAGTTPDAGTMPDAGTKPDGGYKHDGY